MARWCGGRRHKPIAGPSAAGAPPPAAGATAARGHGPHTGLSVGLQGQEGAEGSQTRRTTEGLRCSPSVLSFISPGPTPARPRPQPAPPLRSGFGPGFPPVHGAVSLPGPTQHLARPPGLPCYWGRPVAPVAGVWSQGTLSHKCFLGVVCLSLVKLWSLRNGQNSPHSRATPVRLRPAAAPLAQPSLKLWPEIFCCCR